MAPLYRILPYISFITLINKTCLYRVHECNKHIIKSKRNTVMINDNDAIKMARALVEIGYERIPTPASENTVEIKCKWCLCSNII